MGETTQQEREAEIRRMSGLLMADNAFGYRLVRDADRLAALERAVIVREDVEARGYEVPVGARVYEQWEEWHGVPIQVCQWVLPFGNSMPAPQLYESAPDSIWLPIISLRESE